MQITIDKNNFSKKFLNPISKITDKGILNLKKDCVECLSTSSFDKKEQTIILFSKYSGDFDLGEDTNVVKLNLPDINKLINVFSFLSEDSITLDVNNNNLCYTSNNSGTTFKYHLLEEGVLESPSVKMENVYKLGFDFECEIPNNTFKTVLKASSFADKTNKIYLYTIDNKLFGILTDENIQNIDVIQLLLSESYTGKDIINKIPINLEIFRVLSTLNFECIKIKINIEKGIIMFEIKENNYLLQYIITALVK